MMNQVYRHYAYIDIVGYAAGSRHNTVGASHPDDKVSPELW